MFTPYDVTNWFHVNSRFLPYVGIAALLRVPDVLPRTLLGLFALSAALYSVGMGIDYVRLDRDRAQFVFDLSSDRGDMMGGIRNLYLAPDQALTADEKALLLRLTNLFERVVWMLQRYADLLLKNVDAMG